MKGVFKRQMGYITCLFILLLSLASQAAEFKTWTVDGLKREALLSAPASAKQKPSPLVFVFHGHGGTAQHASRVFDLESLWPEAVVVYMQGVKTPGHITDPEGKRTGWQRYAGDQSDRDLKFFDAVLASLKADYNIDRKRIYSTGHSNGGAFTYLLWAERGDIFAAMAPSGAAAPKQLADLKPKPVLHIAGENDPLVKYAWQKHTINAVIRINGCEPNGSPWKQNPAVLVYPSKIHTPVFTLIHSHGHGFFAEIAEVIVKFFKAQTEV